LLRRLERLQDRLDVDRPATEFTEARLERLGRRQSLDEQAVEQFVDHARVCGQEVRQERAR